MYKVIVIKGGGLLHYFKHRGHRISTICVMLPNVEPGPGAFYTSPHSSALKVFFQRLSTVAEYQLLIPMEGLAFTGYSLLTKDVEKKKKTV